MNQINISKESEFEIIQIKESETIKGGWNDRPYGRPDYIQTGPTTGSGYPSMRDCFICAGAMRQINNDPNSNVRADGLKYMINTIAHWCGFH